MAYSAVPTITSGDFGNASWANKVAGNDEFWATVIDTATSKLKTNTVITASITALAVTEAKLAAGAVSRAKLKAQTEALNVAVAGINYYTMTFSSVGTYGFYPQISENVPANIEFIIGYNPGASQITQVGAQLFAIQVGTAFATIVYIQASPPHTFLDDEDHGLWLFALWDKAADRPVRMSSAMDPPWWLRNYQELGPAGKRDPDRFWIRSHPFGDDVLDPGFDMSRPRSEHSVGVVPQGYEVRLYDLRHRRGLVDHRPAADRLAEFDGRQHQADPSDIAAFRQTLVADRDAEATDADFAAGEIPVVEEWERQQLSSPEAKDPDVAGAVRQLATARLENLRGRLIRRREVDLLVERAERRPGGLLAEIEAGRLPFFEECTECLSSSDNPPAELPAIYRGSNPLVRVITTR